MERGGIDAERSRITADFVQRKQPVVDVERGVLDAFRRHRARNLLELPDEARAKDLGTQKEFRDKLAAIDGSQLTGASNVDFRILKENIDYQIFQAEELKEPDWNPLVYMQSLANSLYLLVARDFASAEKRIPNLRQRIEGIPRVIAQAKANLQHSPRVHTETAIE